MHLNLEAERTLLQSPLDAYNGKAEMFRKVKFSN